jgi:hypothetical protein
MATIGHHVRSPGASQRHEPLPVLRFSLRHLFWFVTLFCVLLAALVASVGSGVMPLALLLAVLVVTLHVTGTALGTRLRAHADSQIAHSAPIRRLPAPPLPRPLLHERGFLNRWLPIWVAAGAVVGSLAGVGALIAFVGHRATVAGIAVGTLSTAILGAWFAFLAVSSWAIVRQGWRDAVANHHRDQSETARQ